MFDVNSKLYCLVLFHETGETLKVGGFGEVHWRPGWLYYVGRSQWGWGSRIKRFAREDRSNHWHVDYLESSPNSRLKALFPVRAHPDRECDLARGLMDQTGLEPLADGLGASDCGGTCRGHVLVGSRGPAGVFDEFQGHHLAPSGGVVFREDACRWVEVNSNQWDPEATGG